MRSAASSPISSAAHSRSRDVRGRGLSRRLRDDRGAATAELAVALPVVVLTLLLGGGALAAGTRQVAMQDAVADAARLLARGEGDAAASHTVHRAVAGAQTSVGRHDGLICVSAKAVVPIAGALTLPIRTSSCALDGGL